MILAKLFFVCTLLPLSFNQAHTLHIGQMQNIDTVGTVDRHTTSAGDKSHNLISRNRAAALTEMHSHIIKSLDHNSALGMLWHILLLILPNSLKHFLICQRNRMILAVFIVGGGYPELCARQLSENVSMRNSIREAIENGMPSVAECGGFMYLHESMTDEEGENWPMAGIITGSCHNRGKLVRFGYVNVMEQTSHFLAGKPVRAHEFHYYDSDNNGESCVAVKPVSGTSWTCIHEDDRNWWGYPHLYYPSNPAFVEHFVQAARLYHRERNAK